MTKGTRNSDSEMARCRRVRDELDSNFKTIDEALAYLTALEKKQESHRGSSVKAKPSKPKTVPRSEQAKTMRST